MLQSKESTTGINTAADDYDYTQGVRRHLDYPDKTMAQMVEDIARQYPDAPAYDFYGRRISYSQMLRNIEQAARALRNYGVSRDEAVTICLPNIPQAIETFYAVDRIGAVANMVHPLSARDEIAYYLNYAKSRIIITLDMFYEKVMLACEAVTHPVTIVTIRMQEVLPLHLKIAYIVKEGRKHLCWPRRQDVAEGRAMLWKNLLKKDDGKELPPHIFDKNHTAVILYSGGTPGKPKGVCLSDLNFNALGIQAREVIQTNFRPGLTMLSCMPLFHGFGLGINIHTVLIYGACCILMPTFNISTYAKMLIGKRPNFIAGVPTIFEALLNTPALEGEDLSFLMGMFSGGDSLALPLKEMVDAFLHAHGASIQVREGYGLTECVTASCLTPKDTYKPHSIGLPFPDTFYEIVRPGTDEVLPANEEGEIVLKGPTLMLGYLDEPEETAAAMRRRSDGDIWLYTGDLGRMDEEGYVYFSQRMKRMIITNGYNVYPGRLEDAIDSCDIVSYSCEIGVPDQRRGQRIKAFVVLRDGIAQDDESKKIIMDHIRRQVAGYALPKEIEFRQQLPRTLVGKVAYRQLEEQEIRE